MPLKRRTVKYSLSLKDSPRNQIKINLIIIPSQHIKKKFETLSLGFSLPYLLLTSFPPFILTSSLSLPHDSGSDRRRILRRRRQRQWGWQVTMAGGGRRQLGTAADKDEHGWEQVTYGRGRWRLLTVVIDQFRQSILLK
jgi:hypothetical protein